MTNADLQQTMRDMRPGDHLCSLHQTEEERRAVLVAFLRHGFERREKVLYLGDDLIGERALVDLRDQGLNVQRYVDSGQLTILSPAEGTCAPGPSIRMI